MLFAVRTKAEVLTVAYNPLCVLASLPTRTSTVTTSLSHFGGTPQNSELLLEHAVNLLLNISADPQSLWLSGLNCCLK